MIKSELIQLIADKNPHLYQRDVENIVNAILGEITDALANGDRVELRGFGAFSVKNRQPRLGRNPRTGEKVSVEEKWVPFFKTGKELRERLNGVSHWQPFGFFDRYTACFVNWFFSSSHCRLQLCSFCCPWQIAILFS